MTHCRLSAVKCSAFWADGSAMLTMVASSTTMSWATPRRARTAHRLGRGIKWVSGLVVLITVLPGGVMYTLALIIHAVGINYKPVIISSVGIMPISAIIAGVMSSETCSAFPSAVVLLPRLAKQVM